MEEKGKEEKEKGFFSELTHPAVSLIEKAVPKMMPPYATNRSNGLNAEIQDGHSPFPPPLRGVHMI